MTVDIRFGERLEDQTLGEQQLILRLQPSGSAALVAQVHSGFCLKPLRCKPFDTQDRPSVTSAEVLTAAGLNVPPTRNHPVPKHLDIGVVDATAAVGDILAFGLDPQLVVVTTVGTLGIPSGTS